MLLDHRLWDDRQYDCFGFYMLSSNRKYSLVKYRKIIMKQTLFGGKPHLADRVLLNSLIDPSDDITIRY